MPLRRVRALAQPLRDMLAPLCCAGCGGHGSSVCAGCRAVFSSGAAMLDVAAVPDLPVAAAVAYSGPSRRMLTLWKDADRRDVTPVLALGLRQALACIATELEPWPRRHAGGRLLVPVPSRRSAVRRRGRDVTADLARAAVGQPIPGTEKTMAHREVERVGLLRASPVLRVARRLEDQAGLTATQRRRNVDGAFVVTADAHRFLRGAEVVVVDDVVTTGASVAEAVRAVRAVGARVLAVAAVCASVRHFPPAAGIAELGNLRCGTTLPLEHRLSTTPRLH